MWAPGPPALKGLLSSLCLSSPAFSTSTQFSLASTPLLKLYKAISFVDHIHGNGTVNIKYCNCPDNHNLKISWFSVTTEPTYLLEVNSCKDILPTYFLWIVLLSLFDVVAVLSKGWACKITGLKAFPKTCHTVLYIFKSQFLSESCECCLPRNQIR